MKIDYYSFEAFEDACEILNIFVAKIKQNLMLWQLLHTSASKMKALDLDFFGGHIKQLAKSQIITELHIIYDSDIDIKKGKKIQPSIYYLNQVIPNLAIKNNHALSGSLASILRSPISVKEITSQKIAMALRSELRCVKKSLKNLRDHRHKQVAHFELIPAKEITKSTVHDAKVLLEWAEKYLDFLYCHFIGSEGRIYDKPAIREIYSFLHK